MSYYLLDANTFIEAKNRYYSMTICPGFWQWITNSNKAKQIESISFVADELRKGNDKLSEWAKENPQIFDQQFSVKIKGTTSLYSNSATGPCLV